MNEIEFEKYQKRGAGYHWEQISYHPLKRNAFVAGRYKNCLTLLKSHVTILNSRILDVGCGDGVLTYLLYKDGAKAYGIDSSDIAIRFAKEKTLGCDIDFCCGSAYELPYEDGFFDAVVSSDVIEHLEQAERFLLEIRRVVKKDGTIVISTPIRFTEAPLDRMHVVEWFPREYQQVILKVFPKSQFYETHPVFWFEMLQRSTKLRIIVNLLSLFKNPFENVQTKFCYKAIQYSVSQKE